MSLLKRAIKRIFRLPTPEQRFFTKSYDERIAEVTTLYSDAEKQRQMTGYFQRTAQEIQDEQTLNPRLFYDALLGFATVAKPQATMQLGCFTATELQWLRHHNLGGKLVGADHSQDYLKFLRDGFAQTVFDGFDFRCFNLDRATPENFQGIEMVTGMAVVSNVQPESMDNLIGAMAQAGVKTIMFGDMYVAQSLTGDPAKLTSYPLSGSRNWAHPYRALGRRHGYDVLFFPCFTYSSFKEARGVFAMTKGLDQTAREEAMRLAITHYTKRENACWDAYGAR